MQAAEIAIPVEAEGYTTWAVGSVSSQEPLADHVSIVYFARWEERGQGESHLELSHAVRRYSLHIKTPSGTIFPLRRGTLHGDALVHEDIEQLRVFYASPAFSLLAVQCGTMIYFYRLPTQQSRPDASNSLDCTVLESVFGKGAVSSITRESNGVPLQAVGEGILIPGGRRSSVLVDGAVPVSSRNTTDCTFKLIVAALEGMKVHLQVIDVVSFSSSTSLRVVARTEGGLALPSPASKHTYRVENWSVDWIKEELVLVLEEEEAPGLGRQRPTSIRSKISPEAVLARLAFGPVPGGRTAALPLKTGLSESGWLLSSAAPPPYLNASTRHDVGGASEVIFARGVANRCTGEEVVERSVWVIKRQAMALDNSRSAAASLLVKDIGSSRQTEHHLLAPRPQSDRPDTLRPSVVAMCTAIHAPSGANHTKGPTEVLIILLGTTLYLVPAVEPSRLVGAGKPSLASEGSSLLDLMLESDHAGESSASQRETAQKVLLFLNQEVTESGPRPAPPRSRAPSVELPPVLRDSSFIVSCDKGSGGATSHLVLDELLLSAPKPLTRRKLLRYISMAQTLHPATVATAMIWMSGHGKTEGAGDVDAKGSLLALASVLASKKEMKGGPERLPGWFQASSEVYRQGSGADGSSWLLRLWRHAAVVAETALTAVAVGSHSALVLLLQVLVIATTTLYHLDASVTHQPAELFRVHLAEARAREALHTLSQFSDGLAHAGSAWGVLTAHLPLIDKTGGATAAKKPAYGKSSIFVSTERRKEAGLRPGTAYPISTSRGVDIVPLSF